MSKELPKIELDTKNKTAVRWTHLSMKGREQAWD
jgi:hypothetical protein